MLDEQDKALAVAIRTNATLRLPFNAPLRLQPAAMAFLESLTEEDVFDCTCIPLDHLRACWGLGVTGERPTVESSAALSRAAIHVTRSAIKRAKGNPAQK
jgi:hypothetical protein